MDEKLKELCIYVDKCVDYICKKASPRKYAAYNGNHCIQTAACVKYVLDEMAIGDSVIKYGIMGDDSSVGVYNHAYVVLSVRSQKSNFLIDVSRKEKRKLVERVAWGIDSYGLISGVNIDEYNDVRIYELTNINFKEIKEDQNEFFTGESSDKLFRKVYNECNKKKLIWRV